MYYVQKRMEVAYAHNLRLPYDSKCKNIHGHNGVVVVYCKSKEVDPATGMVIDFTVLKKLVQDRLDHAYINDLSAFHRLNPTAENMAKWICDTINDSDNNGLFLGCICYKVTFQESEGNVATYVLDEEDA